MLTGIGKGIVQNCFVVTDLEAAIDSWVETAGAGPFYVQHDISIPVEHRGQPSALDMHLAMGQCGDLQIELVQIAGKKPGIYDEMYPGGGNGFHHVAVFVDNFAAAVQSFVDAGSPVAAIGAFNGCGFAYLDTRARTGYYTELYDECENMRALYRNIAAGAKGWNGSDRIRPFADVV